MMVLSFRGNETTALWKRRKWRKARNRVVLKTVVIVASISLLTFAIIQQHSTSSDNESDESSRNLEGGSPTSSLRQVWYALAFGYCSMVWLVIASMKPDIERFSTEGVQVWGHVMECSKKVQGTFDELDEITQNTHYALVDYTVERTTLGGKTKYIHVRKLFETDKQLEQGFANMAILVLPDDPRNSVAKEEWERQYEEYVDGKEERCCSRLSPCIQLELIVGGIMIAISIAGATFHVLRLPPNMDLYGWLNLVLGVAVLAPSAVVTVRFIKFFLSCWGRPLRRGIIYNVPKQSLPEEELGYNPPNTEDVSNAKAIVGIDQVHQISVLSSRSDASQLPMGSRDEDDVSSEGKKGKYYVKMPARELLEHLGRSSISEISSMSANSAENEIMYHVDAAWDKLKDPCCRGDAATAPSRGHDSNAKN